MFEGLPAIERIAFQHNSTLAKQLVILCGEFLTWVETTKRFTEDKQLSPITPSRIQEATNYTNNTFAPALIKLLASELKLNVLVLCYKDLEPGYAMLPIFRNVADGTKIRNVNQMYSGLNTDNVFNPNIFDLDHNTISLDTGSFAEIVHNFIMILQIFPAFYLCEEAFGGIVPLTAEEHAAAILHECGHALSLCEHIDDLYHKVNAAGNSISYLSETTDDKTSQIAISEIKTDIKKSTNSQWTKAFDQAISEIDKNKQNLVGITIAVVTASLAGLYLCIKFWKVFTSRIEQIEKSARYGTINSGSHKSSDTVITESNASYNETIADEFVSRYGLGAAFASGLKKLFDAESSAYVRLDTIIAMRQQRGARELLYGINAIIQTFHTLTFVDIGTYDPPLLRLEKLLQNNMVVFKDPKLSTELRNYYIKETTTLLQTVEEYKNSKGYKIRQLFWGTIMRILSRGSVSDGLRTAGLSSSYDILQQLTNGLIKNPLFLHAARLKSL